MKLTKDASRAVIAGSLESGGIGGGKQISAMLFQSAERKSTVKIVIDKFKEVLKDGSLRPGDRLPSETELCKSLQASRSSIREAVKTLVGFGVLDVRQGDGTYISRSMSNSLFDHQLFQILASNYDRGFLVELREILEIGVIDLAIQNMTPEDLQNIEDIHKKIKGMLILPKFDPNDTRKAETEFHFALSHATHNPLLEKLYNFTFELFVPHINRSHEAIAKLKTQGKNSSRIADRDYIINVHEGILESLRRRDPKMARQAVRKSLKIWRKYMF